MTRVGTSHDKHRARKLTVTGCMIALLGSSTSIYLLAHTSLLLWLLPLTVLLFVIGSIRCDRGWQLHRIEQARRRNGQCVSCGYPIDTGMHTCPECGSQRRV